MDVKLKAEQYAKQSMRYLRNASKFIETGDFDKASEFLWGSMAQALKAVAASNGILLRNHNAVHNYAIELIRTLEDEGIWYAFTAAQSPHMNFYESGLQLEDVLMAGQGIQKGVGKLLSLIPDEKANNN